MSPDTRERLRRTRPVARGCRRRRQDPVPVMTSCGSRRTSGRTTTSFASTYYNEPTATGPVRNAWPSRLADFADTLTRTRARRLPGSPCGRAHYNEPSAAARFLRISQHERVFATWSKCDDPIVCLPGCVLALLTGQHPAYGVDSEVGVGPAPEVQWLCPGLTHAPTLGC